MVFARRRRLLEFVYSSWRSEWTCWRLKGAESSPQSIWSTYEIEPENISLLRSWCAFYLERFSLHQPKEQTCTQIEGCSFKSLLKYGLLNCLTLIYSWLMWMPAAVLNRVSITFWRMQLEWHYGTVRGDVTYSMAKHSSKSKDLTFYLDCTSQCSLKKHADIVLSCVALGNLKLLQHCKSICRNPFQIVDHVGRNALLVAASKGHLHIVAWLLAKKRVSINLADFESRWSALHRSIFYGHLGVALHLSKVQRGLIEIAGAHKRK